MPTTTDNQITDDLRPPAIVKNPEERLKILVERTKNITIENGIPIKRYFTSGKELLRMANTYLDENDHENAFLFYMKYITLFLEKLPGHPQYKTAEEKERKLVIANVKQLFLLAEECKTRIKHKYKKEYDDYLMQKKEYDLKLEEANKQLAEQRKVNEVMKKNEVMETFVSNFQTQLDMKKKELVEQMEEKLVEKIRDNREIPSKKQLLDESIGSSEEEEEESFSGIVPSAPPASSSNQQQIIRKPPVFDRSTKPSISLLDDFAGEGLRKMIVPFKILTEKFIKIAQANTDRNIETCGILCGELKRDRFKITHILIPKQTGTSDSCTSINEEELAMEQEKYNLITMGWIHTHPTQRSFLSSIDLHTHALYQKMLPESIAIVVAPSTEEIHMYSLTDHGLEFILACRQTGFHPHANEQSLYQQSDHVIIDDNLQVQLIDLR